MKFRTEVGLDPSDIVRWGLSSPSQKGHSPQFSAHVSCGQTAGWIKMPLGVEVGLSPGHNVLDGDPPSQRGTAPQFLVHVYCGQTAGWIKMPLGTEVDLGPGHIVLHGGQLCPPRKQSPSFRQMSIVAKWSPMSATAELLFTHWMRPI